MTTIRLSCASCPWTWRGRDQQAAERAASWHEFENGHCVMNDSKED